MGDDDLGIQTGDFYTAHEAPEDRREKQMEEAHVRAAKPFLNDLIDRLSDRIEFYDSIDSIPSDARTTPEEFMNIVNANKLTKGNLQGELDWIIALRDTYL